MSGDKKDNGADDGRAMAELFGVDIDIARRFVRGLAFIMFSVGFGASFIVDGFRQGSTQSAADSHDYEILDARITEIGRRIGSLEANQRFYQADFRQTQDATIKHIQESERRLRRLESKTEGTATRVENIENELKTPPWAE